MVHLRSTSRKLQLSNPSLNFFLFNDIQRWFMESTEIRISINTINSPTKANRIRNVHSRRHTQYMHLSSIALRKGIHTLAALRETLLTLILINYSPTIQLRYTISLSLSFFSLSRQQAFWRNRNRTADHWLRSLSWKTYVYIYIPWRVRYNVCRVTFGNDLSKRILIVRRRRRTHSS